MSVIRVRKLDPGWEKIPNVFSVDLKLSVDAVAVGLWLACKPDNWEVRPAAVQAEFSRRPGKVRGDDWWRRVARELRSAGYLKMMQYRVPAGGEDGGKYVTDWQFCIFGVEQTDPESAALRSAEGGSADPGSAPPYIQDPIKPIPILTTTKDKEVGVKIEELVEAAAWQQRQCGFKKSEAAFRAAVRKRMSQGQPSQEDLQTLQAWRKAMAPKLATPPVRAEAPKHASQEQISKLPPKMRQTLKRPA